MTRSRIRLAAVAAMTWLLAAPASAQEEQALIVAMPDGFKMVLTHTRPDGLRTTEFAPEGQTADNWQQMITVQRFPKLAGADPVEFISWWTQHLLTSCPRARASRHSQDIVSGHLAARVYVHMTECESGPPESVLAVVIRGQDAMHMIQHTWRPLPPTPEQLRAAMDDLDRARLCATRDAACVK